MIDPKRMELAANAAMALVIASVVVAAVQLGVRFSRMDTAPTTGPVSVAVSPSSLDLTPILNAAPFGVAAPTLASGAAASSLVLRGVVVANPISASSAWIAGPDGKAKSVSIGGDAGGGAVLESVAADHVVLAVGGRREKLAFAKSVSRQGVANIVAGIPTSVLGVPAPAPLSTVTLLPTTPAAPPPPPAPSTAAAPVARP